MRDRFWTCKDGRKILVSNMQTSHIESILRMMQRKPGWRALMRPRLELELDIRRWGLRK